MKIFEKLGKRNIIIISIILAVILTASIVIPIVVINSKKCKHNHDILKYDATGHWLECKCGEKENFTSHSPEIDDVDCTTQVKCISCDYIITEAKSAHTQADDDGNCTTPVKCKNCEHIMIEAKEHNFTYSSNGSTFIATCENGCIQTIALYIPANLEYNGEEKPASLIGDYLTNAEVVYSTTNGKAPVLAGTYTATSTIQGHTISITYTISKATPKITAPTTKENLIYNEQSQELINAGSSIGGTMQYKLDDSEWTTTIPKAKNAGTYTIYYKVVGNENYNDVSEQSFTVTIANVSPTLTIPTNLTATYGDTLSNVILKISPSDTEGNWEWNESSETSVGNAGNNTFKATFTPADSLNYKIVELNLTIAVEKATPNYTLPTDLTATYGDTLVDVILPKGFSWQDATTTSVGNAGNRSFKINYTPDDINNYKIVTEIEVTIIVSKADPKYTIPTDVVAYVGQTYSEITLPNGWIWHDDLITGSEASFKLSVNSAGKQEKNTAYFTPEDTNNYNIIETSINFYVYIRMSDTLVAVSNQTYTGSEITPEITVTIDEVTLVKDIDYTLSYSDNENAGTATITITGIGEKCTETTTATFEITPKIVTEAEVTLNSYNKIYSGTEKKPTISSIVVESKTLTTDDYTLAYENNIYVGTATIIITFKGNYDGQITVYFEIIKDPNTGEFDGEWVTIIMG